MKKNKTIASTAPLQIGDLFDYVGIPHKVIGKITRELWWADFQRRKEEDNRVGVKPKRAGIYYPDTKEFRPSREEPGPEFMYCYVLKEI